MQLHTLHLKQVSSAEFSLWKSWLPPEELPDTMSDLRLCQRICGWALARRLLAQELSLQPEQVVLSRSDSGAPFCPDRYLSISHSDDLVVCAIDDRPVGVDVQQVRPPLPHLLSLLSPAERATWSSAPTDQQARIFSQFWAMREAWAKCAGRSLDAVRRISFQLDGRQILCSVPGFSCSFLPVEDGYVLAVCQKD